jgi:hypothetical protein
MEGEESKFRVMALTLRCARTVGYRMCADYFGYYEDIPGLKK